MTRLFSPRPVAPRHLIPAACALALASLLGATAAQAAPPAMQAAAVVPFVNGGIGTDEARQIESQARGYNLRLVFSEGRTNEFAADVHLRITGPDGRPVLALKDAGPLTDVRLPPGRYQVDCRFGDQQQHHSVELHEGQPTNLYLHFAHDEGH